MDKRTVTYLKEDGICFFTPYYQQGRGNATTARRIVTGLKNKKIKTKVLAYDEAEATSEIINLIKESCLLHILHFRRFAEWLKNNDISLMKPYIITSGGTDVNIDIFNPKYQMMIGDVLTKAAAITVFSNDAKRKLEMVYPELENRISIVNQSVWLPENNYVKKLETKTEYNPNILLPAGLRDVKDVLFVLPALIRLKKSFPKLTFTILGAALDKTVLKKVEAATEKYPWISYRNEVPLEEMQEVYEKTDIVINTSVSEGQSSALLESMALNKPVVARNNGGNRSIIEHLETGLLFNDHEEFYEQICELVINADLQNRLSRNAKNYVREFHSLEKEIESYIALYEKVIK